MPLSRNRYQSNGVLDVYSIGFDYLTNSHVKVKQLDPDGVSNPTNLTFAFQGTISDGQPGGAQVKLNVVPPNGYYVEVYRDLSFTVPYVDFEGGAELTERNLDRNSLGLLHVAQRAIDDAAAALENTDNVAVALGAAEAAALAAATSASEASADAILAAASEAAAAASAGSAATSAAAAQAIVSDGTKGDIAVSALGTIWSVIARAISFAKMQAIATGVLLGRSTAGSGDIEEISIGSSLTLAAGTLSGTPASETQAGVAELATTAEVQAAVDTARVPSVASMSAGLYRRLAAAWVVFNASADTISANYNVASITNLGTGSNRVNFTTAMPNADYAVAVGQVYSVTGSVNQQTFVQARTTTHFDLGHYGFVNQLYSGDPASVHAVVFGSQ